MCSKVNATLHSSNTLKPDLVLISPLRRTLQTAVGLFPNVKKVRSMKIAMRNVDVPDFMKTQKNTV